MRRLKTAIVTATVALGIALAVKDVFIRYGLGVVELRRDPAVMSMSSFVSLVLLVLFFVCLLALTAVDYAVWRRSKSGTDSVDRVE
jgi:hypothetical protein